MAAIKKSCGLKSLGFSRFVTKFAVVLTAWYLHPCTSRAGATVEEGTATYAEIYGASTCSTSGCHGGAEPKRVQYVIWSQRDPHSRSYATLATARSARMGEALGIADVTTSTRCTTCHAPLQAVRTDAPQALDVAARVEEGVSCVSCHGPAGEWVRSHPRADFNHAARVAAGLKDLRESYARANTCVACHQEIDPELIAKGRHPRLIFDLDGQMAALPRHWSEDADHNGAQAWLVGQLVAWREASRALTVREAANADEVARWKALGWVLRVAEPTSGNGAVRHAGASDDDGAAAFALARDAADARAREVSKSFLPETVPARLKALAATHGGFTGFAGGRAERSALAYRAERLVMGLDRLWAALPSEKRSAEAGARIDALFAQVQSIPDFSPEKFGRELAALHAILP